MDGYDPVRVARVGHVKYVYCAYVAAGTGAACARTGTATRRPPDVLPVLVPPMYISPSASLETPLPLQEMAVKLARARLAPRKMARKVYTRGINGLQTKRF